LVFRSYVSLALRLSISGRNSAQMPRPKDETILKRWSDWSAGIGFCLDDGKTPGMYYSTGLLGLRGELRPAPISVLSSNFPVYTIAGWIYDLAATQSVVGINLNSVVDLTITSLTNAKKVQAALSSNTLTLGIPAGTSNRMVIVAAVNNGTVNPTGVTYNGTALTLIVQDTTGANRVSFWRLKAADFPANGDVVVTWAGAVDSVCFTMIYDNVNQTTITFDSGVGRDLSTTGPSNIKLQTVTSAAAKGRIITATAFASTAATVPDIKQTSLDSGTAGTVKGAVAERALALYETDFTAQYFFDEPTTANNAGLFLYVVCGFKLGGYVELVKIDAAFANAFGGGFGVVQDNAGTTVFLNAPGPVWPGQCVRYKGFWHIPQGNDSTARSLTVVGISAQASTDTLSASTTPHAPGADHFVNLDGQVAGYVREGVSGVPGLGGVGAQDGGVRILKVDGAVVTAADWGTAFPVGDTNDHAAALLSTAGLTFVLQQEGLYSFDKEARSRLVFEDFRRWRTPFRSIPTTTWKGLIVLPHPSGLLLYPPGETPYNVGVEAKQESWQTMPSLAPLLYGGRYLSATNAGTDYLYVLYQPDVTSTTALVLCGFTPNPRSADVSWQCVGTMTMSDINFPSGIHALTRGGPLSASYDTPTLWYQDTYKIAHKVLDSRGGPFRARSTTANITPVESADAYMSELTFSEPMDLTELEVHTRDMLSTGTLATNDRWQFSCIFNNDDTLTNLGGPVIKNGRTVIKLDRKRVYRLVLSVAWASTIGARVVMPSIREITLRGRPSEAP